MEEFDVVIIGGGPGGYPAALRVAQLGGRVALIEKERLGGTCLNCGCIPTKTLVRSVEVYLWAKKAAQFGVDIGGEVSIDFARMMARKDEVVDALASGLARLLAYGGVTLYQVKGRILSLNLVKVDGQEIATKRIVIATGSVPARPPIRGFGVPGVLTSAEILELEGVPESLAVIGGGVIGLEFTGIFHALGTKVTVLEMLPTLLPPMDGELTRRYKGHLQREEVEVRLEAQVKEIRPKGDRLAVYFSTPEGDGEVEVEKVLLATGRVPYTEGLGLEALGVKLDKGAIAVDEHMSTSVPGIYAVGDVTGKAMLAHVASRQGEVAAENIMGCPVAMDYRVVPNCVFTLPEMAGVGLTEKEAKEEGVDFAVTRFPFSASGRALTMGETAGLVKLICKKGTGKVLGLHIMGPHASDLIAEGALAIKMGATAEDIAGTIHPHPTLPEAIMEAAWEQLGVYIHYQKKQR